LIFQNGEIPGNLPEFQPEGANFGRSARIRHLSRDRASSHGRAMESHEWKLNGEDGKRFYRGNYMSGRWTILTTQQKRNPVWDRLDNPPQEVWAELRDIVWKKYQRKRCPWERVAELDRILGTEGQDH
jgi:hypothetical protein